MERQILKVHDCSENCSNDELEIFSLPPTQVDVEDSIYTTGHALDGYNKNPIINLKVAGDLENYIDLSQTEFFAIKIFKLLKLSNEQDGHL